MKQIQLLVIALTCLVLSLSLHAQTLTQKSNRYGMKLTENGQGGYKLLQEDKYQKAGMDVAALSDVLVPYQYAPQHLQSKLYRGVETVDYVYKKQNGYELVLSVDKAVSDTPTPFIPQFGIT